MTRTFEECGPVYVDNIKSDLTGFAYELSLIGSGYRQWLAVVNNVMNIWDL
jgi:ribosomal protein L6P/L9E